MKQAGRYLLILAAVIILWNTMILKPLRLFAVFLHELGHALMSFIFGYGIQELRINLDESGYALTLPKNGFSAFMIANGGYLGTVLFAVLILYLKRTAFKKFILGAVALLLLFVAVRFSGLSFTLLYSALFAAFVLLLYMVRNDKIDDWVLDVIGVAAVAYSIYDILVDTILLQINLHFQLIRGWGSSQPLTDAVQLERMTHVPAVIWGLLWLAIAVFAAKAALLGGKGGKGSKGGRR